MKIFHASCDNAVFHTLFGSTTKRENEKDWNDPSKKGQEWDKKKWIDNQAQLLHLSIYIYILMSSHSKYFEGLFKIQCVIENVIIDVLGINFYRFP